MSEAASPKQIHTLLLGSTFVIAVCGLVYELLAGTVSSYLLGDSVYQFSLVIGLFMAAMGVGSFLSRFVTQQLVEAFVVTQIFIALVGGTSALVLFAAFSVIDNYTAFLVLELIAIGAAVGLEIPLVIRILQEHRTLKINLSNVLTLDYVGALFASLLFPLVLVPQLGLIRTSVVFGLLNAGVAAIAVWAFRNELKYRRTSSLALVMCAALLAGVFIKSEDVLGFYESRLFAGEVIFAKTSPYQRIVVTRSGETINLFINGALQFSSIDEYRYHESLVHPVMSLARRHDNILIIGGGDGLAVREISKYKDVGSMTLVDLDPVVTDFFSVNPLMRRVNGDALSDPRLTIINDDAWRFLETTKETFDVIVIDLPDPSNLSLSKLYSKSFYTLAAKRLNADGLLVTQATSPVFATQAYWSIIATLRSVTSPANLDERLQVRPYHVYVPSFGEWGFAVAGIRLPKWESIAPSVATRFIDASVLESMPVFPRDMIAEDVDINTIQTHVLVRYYETGWNRWYE